MEHVSCREYLPYWLKRASGASAPRAPLRGAPGATTRHSAAQVPDVTYAPGVLAALLLAALTLLALYFTVRKAVTHGILDADQARKAREREERFEEQLRDGTLPHPPES